MSNFNQGQSDDDPQGDFISLFTTHHDQLLRYIYSLVGNWQDAQDVLQKTSLILWRKFDQYEAGTSFSSWANRVAFYESKNFLRTSAKDRHIFSDDLLEKISKERSETGSVDSSKILQALQHCLEKLSPEENELIQRVYQDREAVTKLSAETGRAIQTVYNQLFKLRRQLQGCIEITLLRLQKGSSS